MLVFNINWDSIPEEVSGPLQRYYQFGDYPGTFVELILLGDLYGCINRCSPSVRPHLADIAVFISQNFPLEAYDSPDCISQWMSAGGLNGRRRVS